MKCLVVNCTNHECEGPGHNLLIQQKNDSWRSAWICSPCMAKIENPGAFQDAVMDWVSIPPAVCSCGDTLGDVDPECPVHFRTYRRRRAIRQH